MAKTKKHINVKEADKEIKAQICAFHRFGAKNDGIAF